MAKESGRQKEIVGRVMHEFKHGELETAGRKIRNPRQAIAIGLSEAGASNRQSEPENKRRRARTASKERKGETAQQLKEGPGQKPAARAACGKARAAPRASSVARATRGEPTRVQLYAEAQRRGLTGCSRLSKVELELVLRQH